MKSRFIHINAMFVVTFIAALSLLTGCGKVAIHDDDCVAMMDTAALEMHDMDYASAKLRLNKVLRHSSNKMHRVSADLLMMRICVLTGENKEFFDYRTDAERCMNSIKNEEPYMTDRHKVIWHYVQSSFYRVSASYFQLMRQEKELSAMLDSLASHMEWNDADSLDLTDRLQPEQFVQTQQLVHSADMLSSEGFYEQAIDSLALALHKINRHHLIYNKGVAADDTLTLCGEINDSLSKEMKWINDPSIVAIPEWMAIVREELSIVYGAMGDKMASNYNRNIYFDILDATRQDMQMKQREETLVSQSRMLNLLILLLVAIVIVVCIGTYVVTREITHKSDVKTRKLRRCLDICDRMVNGEDVDDEIYSLLPGLEGDWTSSSNKSTRNLKTFEHEILSFLQIFKGWIAQNTELYETQVEKKENLEGEIYMEQRRMDDNKRQHTDRSTAISIAQGIMPFLDRAIHQVEKGNDYVDGALLREYVEKINAYNEVLGHWVKVKQGSVTLNVENFSLAPLLETLQKGHRSFDSKNIVLDILIQDVMVKADRALTLFMMNTLLDNARKYTPEGGKVGLTVVPTEDYVEISVHDTGYGLSEEDQDKINNMKVYDSSQIGLAADTDGQVQQNKGFGFGLMNCRGIIEKYRKSGKLFDVCQFGVESHLGEGSRFFFRLPKGVLRTMGIMMFFLFPLLGNAQSVEDYIDSVYNSNISGNYEQTIENAECAINILNDIYRQQTGQKEPLMQLYDYDTSSYAELEWFERGVNVDYNLIIQLRNEISLAALSLSDSQLYRYNNESFIRLNKLTSLDPNMEDVCRKLAKTNADKNLIFALSLLVLIIGLLVYALIYYKRTMLPVFNLRQMVEFLRGMFSEEESKLPEYLHLGISRIHPADAVNVRLSDGRYYTSGTGDTQVEIPLSVDFEGETQNVGVMYIAYHGSEPTQEEQIIIDFISKFVAIHIFFASVKIEQQQSELELLEDQRFAAETEQQRLHVQNMVLDNCLSTIKHETMYYPSRVLQLLDSDDNVSEIHDILRYYREVFVLLSENANRQLSRSVVKLQSVKLADMARYAKKSFEKQNRKLMLPLQFEVLGDASCCVRADKTLLQYMLDTLISLAFEMKNAGNVQLYFEKSEGFIKFALSDSRINRTNEENSKLFYADSMKYDAANDRLIGSQFMIAKQIIRAHDERLGHPGCRIFAQDKQIIFTLPITN